MATRTTAEGCVALEECSADKVQLLGPAVLACSRLAGRAERTYGGHLGRRGDVGTLGLADILGPAGHFFSFTW